MGDRAYQSQAAVLLTLGSLLRYEDGEPPDFRARAEEEQAELEIVPPDDLDRLGLPARIRGLAVDRGLRYSSAFVRESMLAKGMEVREPRGLDERGAEPELREAMPILVDRLLEDPRPLTAAQLCAAALASPEELVRVAAATAYSEMTLREEQEPLLKVLVQGTYSEEPTVRDVALTALARLDPNHPRLFERTTPPHPEAEGGTSHTSLLVHGTWASGNSWWQPGGNFHNYLLRTVDPQLYAGTDWRGWSGGYSDAARALGALDLMAFVNGKGFAGLDLFTHSHGVSVAFLASRGGMNAGRLVVLSYPVHRSKYWPDFNRVRKLVSIRVHMDLVILADGNGQRFRDPKIQEIVLPIWFNHSASHDPAVWASHNLPSRI